MAKIILLNKPFNVLCQFTDKEGRPTLADFIDLKGVYPAGRLDYDSEGLVLLTDDGQLQHQISHPNTKMSKTYWVQVEGIPSTIQLKPLTTGIILKDGPCRPAQVRIIEPPLLWPRTPPVRARATIPTCWLELTITEGRNRQVRRMTAAIGFPTLRLIRARIGDWHIQQLAPGQFAEHNLHSSSKKLPNKHFKPRKRTPKRHGKL
ncbi:pseudouridine synthase [Oceanicoccus sp. KOV_DT_Chl]|uniref:pseudouridine synthase n=1 Tax=Oceanicoccus sp. KOV_DT_Chl TaxID=1904639 RepID=UPI000C7A7D58|nr:pseudouridine synthase [Oceanicoccus sp. KOV_DT_Chl]